jgi:hypothetical protein
MAMVYLYASYLLEITTKVPHEGKHNSLIIIWITIDSELKKINKLKHDVIAQKKENVKVGCVVSKKKISRISFLISQSRLQKCTYTNNLSN